MKNMRNIVRMCVALLCAVVLQGCSSVNMQPTHLVDAVPADKALVTFVRPSILGAAIGVDIWDGDHFLGALGSGTLVQVLATPGEHLFLANAENWSYTSANLQGGKKYYIKANMFPGVLYGRVALGVPNKDDKRIPDWLTLDPKVVVPADVAAVEERKRAEVTATLQNFKDGKVTVYSKIGPDDGWN
jgi:hypothetical protein